MAALNSHRPTRRRALAPTRRSSWRVCAGALAAGVLLAGATAAPAAAAPVRAAHATSCPQAVAHRGDHSSAPESTLAAFRAALRARAPIVELDVRFTRNRIPVVIHDATVDRTTDGTGPVSSFSLAELQALDAGGGERVPTLREVLALVRSHRARAMVELKTRPSAGGLSSVLRRIRQTRVRATIHSFDARTIRLVQARRTGIGTGLITRRGRKLAPAVARRYGTAYSPHYGVVTRRYVAQLRRAGVRAYAWTANARRLWSTLRTAGVAGIVTDFAGAYRAWARRACRA